MSDEESVKKLAEMKAYLEKRMAELQDEASKIKSIIEIVQIFGHVAESAVDSLMYHHSSILTLFFIQSIHREPSSQYQMEPFLTPEDHLFRPSCFNVIATATFVMP